MNILRYLPPLISLLAALATAQTVKPLPSKQDVVALIRKVNDPWQKEHPDPGNAFWNRAAYHTGNMAAFQVTGIDAYRKYSEKWSEQNDWQGAKGTDRSKWKYSYGESPDFVLFGDWQACFQVYLDLHQIRRDDKRVARAKEVMGYQISTAPNDYLWWADGLYMVMPVMTKMHRLTGDPAYLQKLHDYFSHAKNLMLDSDSGLFFRDAKYIYPKHKTVNGSKDFWARGNGWIFAAIPRMLDDLPANDPHRAEYVEVYLAMAKTLAAHQRPEGHWTRSIVDPAHAPGPETSGTAFFTFGYLWGINHGVLDRATYLPVAQKGWDFLTETALQPDGTLGYVQPIGEKAIPGQVVDARSTADFGVGAFLLAAAEMARLVEKGR